jgi:hypothetical protein
VPIQNGNNVEPAQAGVERREQALGIAPSPAESRALNTTVERQAGTLIRNSQAGIAALPPASTSP